MKLKYWLMPLVLATAVPISVGADSYEIEASALADQFVGQLKPALVNAMQSGGPINAVNVCAKTAPQIAKQLSEESGWQIRRVSLKSRNPLAAPDEFEAKVLKRFDERGETGETAPIYSQETEAQFRYMRAQLAAGVCLVCHGKEVDAGLRAEIRRHYPNDLATGYGLGEVRGAISLTLEIPE